MSSVAYEHIEKASGEPAHLARLPRIRVAQIVMDYLAHGWSPDEMCQHYPHFLPAETHAAMMYYYDHQVEIDAEIRAELADVRTAEISASPTPFEARLRSKGVI